MSDPHEMPLFDGSLSWEESQAALEGAELGDGLPLVPPTLDRMSAMLASYGSPDQSFGHVMPLMGELTLKAVAYNCILAGCRPVELPLVLSAAEACIEPQFNLLGVLSTTGTPAVAICVHGPIVSEVGLNAGGNCLGPGNRANACVGRGLSLILRNVGGARAGVADMATMGQPGKNTRKTCLSICLYFMVGPIIPTNTKDLSRIWQRQVVVDLIKTMVGRFAFNSLRL